MDYKYEIISAITRNSDINNNDKIDCLKELFYITKEYDFKIAADEIIEKSNICPNCCTDVITKLQPELLGEYGGSPAYCYQYKKSCPKCGWKED